MIQKQSPVGAGHGTPDRQGHAPILRQEVSSIMVTSESRENNNHAAAVPQVGRCCVLEGLFRVWLAGWRRKEGAKGRARRGDRPCPGGLCRRGTDHPRDGGGPSMKGGSSRPGGAAAQGARASCATTAP